MLKNTITVNEYYNTIGGNFWGGVLILVFLHFWTLQLSNTPIFWKTEKFNLLRCKKYIELILFYHLAESSNSKDQDSAKAVQAQASLATNQEILEALNAIQKEIVDLNYPKKIKEKLRERN